MNERQALEKAIEAQEMLRPILGDDVVEATIATLRQQLAGLTTVSSDVRKLVTVLVADLSGFTALVEAMDAEDAGEFINTLWQALDQVIVRYGGRIDKHIGDAVVALWGVDVSREDDAEQAIRASLAMQTELQEGIAGLDDGLKVGMRIGLSTGMVLLGEVGSSGEFSALGDAVNVAHALEAAAPIGGVLIAHDTYRHVRGIFEVAAWPKVTGPARREGITVYEVKQVKARTFRLTTRGVEGVETRMVGRGRELAHLQGEFHTVMRYGGWRQVTVVGEAGLGKSRLLYEFEDWLNLQSRYFLLFKGRMNQARRQLPFALARNFISFRFEIQESDGRSVVEEKFELGFASFLGQGQAEKAHIVGQLLGFDFAHSQYVQGIKDDIRQIHDRGRLYLTQLLQAAAALAPLVFMLEDLQWADEASLALLAYWREAWGERPFLLIGATRPELSEQIPDWYQGEGHSQLHLQPLSGADSERLVSDILRKVPEIPLKLRQLITKQAEGNPFYVEELIKMMLEDGVISKQEPLWRVDQQRLDNLRIPPSLTGVLQARLDRLSVAERRVLQQAAVVGRQFWDEAIAYMAAREEGREVVITAEDSLVTPALARILGDLQAKEMIFQRPQPVFQNTTEYFFKHAILREVTYEQILRTRRHLYHEGVAEWLVHWSGERVGEYASVIANHYEQANQNKAAASWLITAAQRARATYALEQAQHYFEQAHVLLGENASDDLLVAIYEGLGFVYRDRNLFTEALQYANRLLVLAQKMGDPALEARAWLGLTPHQDDVRSSLETTEKAVAKARLVEPLDLSLLARALRTQGWCWYLLGDGERALTLANESLDLSLEAGDRVIQGYSLNLIGVVYQVRGQFDVAQKYLERGLAVRRSIGDRMGESGILNNIGELLRFQGNYEQAASFYRQALLITREIGVRFVEATCLMNLVAVQTAQGAYEEALKYAAEVRGLGMGINYDLSELYLHEAEAYLGMGDGEQAVELALESWELAYKAQVPKLLGQAWRVLGRVTAVVGPLPVDERTKTRDYHFCFSQAEKIFREADIPYSQAVTLWHWSQSARQKGELKRARVLAEEARILFKQQKMSLFLERMGRD
ncbi:MAG TPA: adenylate/guanylate cyclase domain-containing protein [Anaerolineae bacterium]|nr:adenylate/guanylate cyclase domain-containing protein [Anaerolineae bacterium]